MPKALASMSLAELGDEMNNVVTNARNVLERAKKDGRDEDALTDAEMAEVKAFTDQIAPIKGLQSTKQDFHNRLSDLSGAEALMQNHNKKRTPNQQNRESTKADLQKMVWENSAAKHLPREYWPTQQYGSDDYSMATSAFLRGYTEGKGLVASNGPSTIPAQMAASLGLSASDEQRGGYFVVGEQFSTEILKNVDDNVYMQGLSRVIMMPPGSQNYNIRVRTARASSFVFANENTDISTTFDTSLKYGKRVITPNYFQGSVIMSKDLLRNYPGAESMVISELGINASQVLEQAFLTGDGNQKPMGVLTTSNDGIDSSRNLTSDRTAYFSFDSFVKLKYGLKPKYRRSATWMLHRLMLQEVALLKDGDGRYLWEPSRQVGSPDTILGLPFIESEWMPSSLTTGGFYTILGDFQYYYVVWDMAMEMQRLVEMRAYTNEFVYLFRCKLDAAPVLPEAFVRGVLA
ncbi:major_cap_HK97, phage major capsid protein, HK97 family [uncultured Caudovirales phage]|uniref:Major_cap_HK97, phage major capsid protein, HK97 family n=1 Tax=uncultured Caudovirales phage TaxID=2100421 RepID=A0A6J5Q4L5_9CAUD|nr:major_cap_HK97, phage major capsid protein, HK97 family [uncultured Caudovirales phage]CAB4182954.1 major_cap_HK97, phage major capsid protein, HK97 family [uncultured Caudovirales phage]CAB4197563.1 major_cap_HK97, phage major capsid protein, HK97 family [uncultured Caudovirales phage]CAB4211391.1 major_cap_HK97, phage major capsid protein, HK97 family [uncultured Caudovirales phage]CAB5238039.1 major_cap_HK97, phage major capsid protein, HK97 family [uncultured Caudovirales phage]